MQVLGHLIHSPSDRVTVQKNEDVDGQGLG